MKAIHKDILDVQQFTHSKKNGVPESTSHLCCHISTWISCKRSGMWTNTHTYAAIGLGATIVILIWVIHCCRLYRRSNCLHQQQQNGAMVMLSAEPRHRVFCTTWSSDNPYNAGYDQYRRNRTPVNPPFYNQNRRNRTLRIHSSPSQSRANRTMDIPPSYDQAMADRTIDIPSWYDQSRVDGTLDTPPSYDQVVKATAPGNSSQSDPYNAGYDQPY